MERKTAGPIFTPSEPIRGGKGPLIRCILLGQPFVKRFVLCYGAVVCPVCLFCLSVCNVGVLWPNGWIHQDATCYGGRPRPRRHCVRCGPRSLPQKWTQQPPLFGPLYCGTVAHLSNCRALVVLVLFILLSSFLFLFYSHYYDRLFSVRTGISNVAVGALTSHGCAVPSRD